MQANDRDAPPQDEDNLREALRYSAQMLGELRTSFLTPQKYYELYMQVFDELVNLEVGPGADHARQLRAWRRPAAGSPISCPRAPA